MVVLASVRSDIANYVGALFEVYIVLIFIYILLNLLFSFGAAGPVRALDRHRPEFPA